MNKLDKVTAVFMLDMFKSCKDSLLFMVEDSIERTEYIQNMYKELEDIVEQLD